MAYALGWRAAVIWRQNCADEVDSEWTIKRSMANSVHRINSFGALTLISFILLAALCCSAGRASAQGKVRFPVSVASKTFGFSPSGQWRSRFHEPHTDGKQTGGHDAGSVRRAAAELGDAAHPVAALGANPPADFLFACTRPGPCQGVSQLQ